MSIVSPPAKTGRDPNRRTAVTLIAWLKIGILSTGNPGVFLNLILLKKLTAEARDPTPAVWSAKIAKSGLILGCPKYLLKGGYIVQPVPLPPPIDELAKNKISPIGTTQKEKILSRGKIISGRKLCQRHNSITKSPNSNRH